MVKKSKPKITFRKKSKIQGTTRLDYLIIVIVVLTVFAFLAAMLLGPSNTVANTTPSSTTARSATARSATVSNTNPYPYTQPATTTSVQPTYTQPPSIQPTYAQQPHVQDRPGFNNSVPGNINATTAAVAGTGAAYSTALARTQSAPQVLTQNVAQTQANGAIGISPNGQLIGLRPLQPLVTPYIPTTAVTTTVAARSIMNSGSNPTSPYVGNGNTVINIETTQAYRPQNQELIMDQACVNEAWQRNPYVIRSFPNLSIRLSATNPALNGNMRTYSFNLDNRPTGNGALCTVTTDGYVTAISFY